MVLPLSLGQDRTFVKCDVIHTSILQECLDLNSKTGVKIVHYSYACKALFMVYDFCEDSILMNFIWI